LSGASKIIKEHDRKENTVQIKDVMTHNVECVCPEASLKEAASIMKSKDFGALPVCANDRLVGMLTDRDIAIRAVAGGLDPIRTQVGDCMTGGIVYCYEDEDVSEASRIMEEKQIRRLTVLNQDKRLVGIVSLGDIAIRAGSKQLGGEILERVSEPALQHV
jgi:CBS domain-containing protein